MKRFRACNIAHRGARAHAPENTLAAARLARALGADMWETDVCLTRDNHLVLMHDDTLERTTDVARRPEFADRAPWRVEDFTLAEVRGLDAGSWFGETDPFGTIAAGEVDGARLAAWAGEPVPTLEQGLWLTRKLGWRINVEIKDHAGRAGRMAGPVADLIRKLGMEGAVLLSSFQPACLREAGSLLAGTPRALLQERGPGPEEKRRTDVAGILTLCEEAGADFFHPEAALVDASLVAALRDSGRAVQVWTVNRPESMRAMLGYGVHGIITDYPARLRELTNGPG